MHSTSWSAFMILSAIALGAGASGIESRLTLKGRVVDPSAKPIAGARVLIYTTGRRSPHPVVLSGVR